MTQLKQVFRSPLSITGLCLALVMLPVTGCSNGTTGPGLFTSGSGIPGTVTPGSPSPVQPSGITPHITMTTEEPSLWFYMHGTGEVTIDWGDGTIETETTEPYSSVIFEHTFETVSQRTIRVEGDDIMFLFCGGLNLTNLDISNYPALQALNCQKNYNYLTSLDVSNNPALMYVECSDNNLDAAALTDLFEALPPRAAAEGAKIICGNNPGFSTASQSSARADNWDVIAMSPVPQP